MNHSECIMILVQLILLRFISSALSMIVHGILTEVLDKIAVLSKEVKCSRNGMILKEGLTRLKLET